MIWKSEYKFQNVFFNLISKFDLGSRSENFEIYKFETADFSVWIYIFIAEVKKPQA